MKKGRLSPREVGKRLAEKFFAVKNFQYSPPLIWGMKKGRLSPREVGKRLAEKFFAVKKPPILATPYLGHEKRQAFAYLFCPKSYHRPNLLMPYGKLKYKSSLSSKIVLINKFD